MSDDATTPVLTTDDGTPDLAAVLAGTEGAPALEVLEAEVRDGDHDAKRETRFLRESTGPVSCPVHRPADAGVTRLRDRFADGRVVAAIARSGLHGGRRVGGDGPLGR